MKPFNPNPSCPKCAGVDVTVRYKSRSDEEWLGCQCNKCEYNWMMETKKDLPTDSPPSNIEEAIQEWHESQSPLVLHEYLGWTAEQYKKYVEKK